MAMQNRSIMSLELQYLLKTTCKTEAEGREGQAGAGQLVSVVMSDSRAFSLVPTCRLILQRRNKITVGTGMFHARLFTESIYTG